MRVLFLGPPTSPVLAFLRTSGDEVVATEKPLGVAHLEELKPDLIVSHGYRHVLPADVVELVRDRAVNLHISLLPWNRGADPNVWSWLDSTPKGVTIHFIDEGVDTGDVIAQREVAMSADETLASSYAILQDAIVELFRETWPDIRAGRAEGRPQEGSGSTHRLRDRDEWSRLLTGGWDTPVSALRRD